MKRTKHSNIQKRQHGLSDIPLDIVREYGRCERMPDGAVRFYFGNREYQLAVEKLKKKHSKDRESKRRMQYIKGRNDINRL